MDGLSSNDKKILCARLLNGQRGVSYIRNALLRLKITYQNTVGVLRMYLSTEACYTMSSRKSYV